MGGHPYYYFLLTSILLSSLPTSLKYQQLQRYNMHYPVRR